VDNNDLDLGMRKSGFIHTLPGGRLSFGIKSSFCFNFKEASTPKGLKSLRGLLLPGRPTHPKRPSTHPRLPFLPRPPPAGSANRPKRNRTEIPTLAGERRAAGRPGAEAYGRRRREG
jgi:hypothetical protein